MIKISYKDGQNWTDINSNVRNWTNAYTLYKDERIQSAYLVPEIVTDIWNGKIHDVQHLIWDVWHLEYWIKESELQEANKLQGCDTIVITDVDNDLTHTVDMQTADWFNFSEPTRIADTANWLIVFEYRTNKTVINKYLALSNVVTIVAGTTYYSKYAKLPYIHEKQDTKVQWDVDGEKLLYEVNKTGYKVLFYMTGSDMESFKNDYNLVDSLTIDAVSVIEKLPLEIAELGEDNFQIIMSVITAYNENNYYDSLTNTVTLAGNSTYYSKFEKLTLINPVEDLTVTWSDGYEKLLRQTNKIGYKVFLYLSDSAFSTFQEDYNQNSFTIDAATIYEKLPLEVTADANGFYQIIMSVITDIDITTQDLGSSHTNTLAVTDTSVYTYYSDYPVEDSIQDTERNTFSNESGVNTTTKGITRRVDIFKCWLDEADAYALKEHFEIGTATLNTVAVLENRNVKLTKLAYDIYEAEVECLMTTNIQLPQA